MKDIYVYGAIGSGGWFDDETFTVQDMVDGLKEAAGDDVTLHINSSGGDVFDATTMASLVSQYRLQNTNATVTTMVEGLAASAASYLGLTATEVVMSPDSMLMIHNPSGVCYGMADDMRQVAEQLDKVRDIIANSYVRKSGMKLEEAIDYMDAESWFTAEEAVALGLADRVDDAAPALAARIDSKIAATWKNSPIKNEVEEVEQTEEQDNPIEEQTDSVEATDDAEAAEVYQLIGGAVYKIPTEKEN